MCARGARLALLGGPSTSPLERFNVQAKLSLKAIGAGVCAALIASALLSVLASFYLVTIYNDAVRGIDFANELEVQRFSHRVMFHPLNIAFTLITSIVQVAIPGYLAAYIADRQFVVHSLAVTGITTALSCVGAWEQGVWLPLVLFAIWSPLVGAGAGFLRQYQAGNRREAL